MFGSFSIFLTYTTKTTLFYDWVGNSFGLFSVIFVKLKIGILMIGGGKIVVIMNDLLWSLVHFGRRLDICVDFVLFCSVLSRGKILLFKISTFLATLLFQFFFLSENKNS